MHACAHVCACAPVGEAAHIGRVARNMSTIQHAGARVGAQAEADPACDRTHFNAIVTEQELEESFLPPFTHGCVASGSAKSIMCSYNALENDPSSFITE